MRLRLVFAASEDSRPFFPPPPLPAQAPPKPRGPAGANRRPESAAERRLIPWRTTTEPEDPGTWRFHRRFPGLLPDRRRQRGTRGDRRFCWRSLPWPKPPRSSAPPKMRAAAAIWSGLFPGLTGLPADAFRRLPRRAPRPLVVSYINAYGGVKARERPDLHQQQRRGAPSASSLPAERPDPCSPHQTWVRCAPNRVAFETHLWPGSCIVHEKPQRGAVLAA